MYSKGKHLYSGKTKDVYLAQENTDLVFIHNTDRISKREFLPSEDLDGKGVADTNTACAVFELLKKEGVPVAFVERTGETTFVAQKCEMIPLEVVHRRFAYGGYIKRHPDLKQEPPHRFKELIFEVFLKTSGGKLINKKDEILVSNLNPENNEEDPLVANPYEDNWKLLRPKVPSSAADLGIIISASSVLGDVPMEKIHQIAAQTFMILEEAWQKLEYHLIDLKLEFGVSTKGELLLADVITNDCWRVRTNDWEEISKQRFREGANFADTLLLYKRVADLVKHF